MAEKNIFLAGSRPLPAPCLRHWQITPFIPKIRLLFWDRKIETNKIYIFFKNIYIKILFKII
jgi:hypothetical protein